MGDGIRGGAEEGEISGMGMGRERGEGQNA